MNNTFKNNWQETKQRFDSWWAKETLDKPMIMTYSPKGNNWDFTKEYNMGDNLEQFYTDKKLVLNNEIIKFSNSRYFGDMFPSTSAYLGAGSFGAFLGSVPTFRKDTIWYDPCFNDIFETEITLDKGVKWYDWSLDFTEYAVAKANNGFIIAIPDLIEGLDTLAQLVGTEELLYFMMDEPNEILKLQEQLSPLWEKIYDAHYNIVKDKEGYSAFTHFNILGKGRTAKIQCDISAMMSPSLYNELALPYLEKQCDFLDNSLYHLDGPDAIRHLDSVLTLDKLDVLQWTAGAGQPDGGDECWDFIYKKALNAGKNIFAYITAKNIPNFVKKFGSTGVFICTMVDDVRDAQQLHNEIDRITKSN